MAASCDSRTSALRRFREAGTCAVTGLSFFAFGLLSVGCVGTLTGERPPTAGGPPASVSPAVPVPEFNPSALDCTDVQVSAPDRPSQLRRLTDQQLGRFIDLMTQGQVKNAELVPDGRFQTTLQWGVKANYDTDAYSRWLTLAETIAPQVVEVALRNTMCQVVDATCSEKVLGELATRFSREVPDTVRMKKLMEVYRVGAMESPRKGLELATQAIMSSPQFMYRREFVGGARNVLNARETYELLYTGLLGEPVPKELDLDATRSAADALAAIQARPGDLARVKVALIETMVSMLTDIDVFRRIPGKKPEEGLALDGPTSLALVEQVHQYAKAIGAKDGSLRSLYTDSVFPANGLIRKIYLDQPNAPLEFTLSSPPSPNDSGLFGLPGIIARNTPGDHFIPSGYGRFVLEKVLCEVVDNPPPTATDAFKNLTGTRRERFLQMRNKVGCAGCHGRMDPIGTVVEVYDIGGRRLNPPRDPAVNGQGEVIVDDQSVVVHSPAQLGAAIAASAQGSRCFSKSLYQHLTGRVASKADACRMVDAMDRVRAGGPLSVLALEIIEKGY
jgi:Protein of unknown function (DUF1588)